MTKELRTTRRTVLAMAGSIVVAGAAKAEIPLSLERAHLPDPLASIDRLLATSPHPAAVIGQAYLLEKPHEGERQSLVRGLLEALAEIPVGERNPALLAAYVKKIVSRDFAEGRTVALDGWVMSLTEARLCALRALAQTS